MPRQGHQEAYRVSLHATQAKEKLVVMRAVQVVIVARATLTRVEQIVMV